MVEVSTLFDSDEAEYEYMKEQERKEPDLKLCPFCDGQASVCYDPEGTKDTANRHWAYTVVCDKCCATSGLWFSRETATEAWNKRADVAPRAEIAEEIFNGLIKVFMAKQRHYENIRRPGKAKQMIEAREEIYKFKREYYERSRHERN